MFGGKSRPSCPRSSNWTMKIPRTIHQTWKSRELIAPLERCVRTIREVNPLWDHRFYTDDDWEPLVAKSRFISSEQFDRFPAGIQRADIFRCLALLEHGGVYSDVDVVAFRPLDSLIDSAKESGLVSPDTEVILTTDHPIHGKALYHGNEVIMNNFMMAIPNATLFQVYLEEMALLSERISPTQKEPVSTTGPMALTEIIDKHGGTAELKIAIIPYFWVNPLPDMNLKFPGRSYFHDIIADQTWYSRYCPFVAHLWWHNYATKNNMMQTYGELLFPRIGA